MSDVVILGAKRTPMGAFQGALSGTPAPALGGAAIKAALAESGAAPEAVDQLAMGLVLSAGLGQAPARQAGFAGGLPEATPAVTVNKMCGSGLEAALQIHDKIKAGSIGLGVAGGMESMSRAPYLSQESRGGARIGHKRLVDHMYLDGLEDAYEEGRLMGAFAEDCAAAYQFTREAQDDYALATLAAARRATEEGAFAAEIGPLEVPARRETLRLDSDESIAKADAEKIPKLRPAFKEGGTVTAANASSISDGAAALVLADAALAEQQGLRPRARIVGHAGHAQAPAWFSTAPIPAARKLLDRLGWRVEEVDLWEVNEAFAVVPMAFAKDLGVPRETLNVHGGACALGHPIGASGARILVTLLHALERRDLSRGVAAICIGGGEALAIAIER